MIILKGIYIYIYILKKKLLILFYIFFLNFYFFKKIKIESKVVSPPPMGFGGGYNHPRLFCGRWPPISENVFFLSNFDSILIKAFICCHQIKKYKYLFYFTFFLFSVIYNYLLPQ
jgi:hypothetical protein